MTAAHLVFAVGMAAYILAAIRWEERDLIAAHPEYAADRRQVPMFLPRLRGGPSPRPQTTASPAAGEKTFTAGQSSAELAR